MAIATLVLLGALAVAPTPEPTTALAVSPVSTCDNLVVGITNRSIKPIKLTPEVDGYELDPVTVLPGDNVPFTVPGEPYREVALTTDMGVRLGPWVWAAPKGCEDIPAAGSAVRDPGPEIEAKDPRETAAAWLFFLGFLAMIVGLYGMVSHRIRARRYQYIDHSAAVNTRVGRHRAPKENLMRQVRRSISELRRA